jgi:hypothetical protein
MGMDFTVQGCCSVDLAPGADPRRPLVVQQFAFGGIRLPSTGESADWASRALSAGVGFTETSYFFACAAGGACYDCSCRPFRETKMFRSLYQAVGFTALVAMSFVAVSGIAQASAIWGN